MGERIVDGRIEAIVSPTRERAAKRIEGERDVIILEGRSGGVEQRSFDFPLDFYLRKELITRKQWRAGNDLFDSWNAACRSGYVQFQYRESDGGARAMEFTPPGAWAIDYNRAMAAIRGEEERRIAEHVIIDGRSLSTSQPNRSRATGRRIGMPLLLSALDDLAAFYKKLRQERAKKN